MSKIHPETRTYPLQRRFGCKSTIIILIMQIIVYFSKIIIYKLRCTANYPLYIFKVCYPLADNINTLQKDNDDKRYKKIGCRAGSLLRERIYF